MRDVCEAWLQVRGVLQEPGELQVREVCGCRCVRCVRYMAACACGMFFSQVFVYIEL